MQHGARGTENEGRVEVQPLLERPEWSLVEKNTVTWGCSSVAESLLHLSTTGKTKKAQLLLTLEKQSPRMHLESEEKEGKA